MEEKSKKAESFILHFARYSLFLSNISLYIYIYNATFLILLQSPRILHTDRDLLVDG